MKVLVVGDVMLDRYWWGDVTRISPEAPVPVVNLQKTSLVAGGAANVAANIAGLGAQAYLVGIVGDDQEADLFSEVLNRHNVSADNLIRINNRQTTVKTRIIAHHQQVARLDQESKFMISNEETDSIWNLMNDLIDQVDIVIVSDYAKGLLSENLLMRLITKANEFGKKVLIDPKGKNFNKYKSSTLITPNRFEVAEAYKLEEYSQTLIEEVGKKLIDDLSLQSVLITQGEDGMTLIGKNGEVNHITADTKDVYDVTGAGDTVIACLAVAIGSGFSEIDAAKIANKAAGKVIEHIGTTPIKLNMLAD